MNRHKVQDKQIRTPFFEKSVENELILQNTRFSRLKWVANKKPGQAAKTLKDKILKNFLSVFRDWKVYPRGSRELNRENVYPSRLDPSLANKSPKLTRELAAEACDLDDLRLSRQNSFWNFSVFV